MRNIIKLLRGAGWLNILGMTAAFAAIYIILVQVNYEFGFNKQVKDIDRVYKLTIPSNYEEGKYTAHLSKPLGRKLLEQSPLVESYGSDWGGGNGSKSFSVGEGENRKEYSCQMCNMTQNLFGIFGIEPVEGSFEGMGQEKKVAFRERTANALQLHIGDEIKIDTTTYTLCAIYEDQPFNSTKGKTEMVCSSPYEQQFIDNNSEWSFVHYVKLKSASDKEACEEQLTKVLRENFKNTQSTEEEINRMKVRLFPMKDIYFNHEIDMLTDRGNKLITTTLLVIALLIMLITLINYVNFFMAQVPTRLRSVNTRKILGSTRTELVFRFMLESGALVLVSLLFASGVVLLFKDSSLTESVNAPIDFDRNLPIVAVTFAAALLMTAASAIYPALYITSFPPALALKGAMGQSEFGRRFRHILVGFQFVISFLFVICTLLVRNQYDFMMDYDMGFNKESLFTIEIQTDKKSNQAITNELEKKSIIKEVAWAAGPMVNTNRMGWGRPFKGKTISFDCYPVSYNFLRFMGIEVVEGRDFTPADEQCENGVFIFNQKAKNDFGLTLEDKVHGHRQNTDIAGFCKDFLFRPMQYGIRPFAFYVFGKNPWWIPSYLFIRTHPGTTFKEVQQAVRETVAEVFPGYNTESIQLNFFDEELGWQYQKEQKLVKLITLFSLVAIAISLMGIIGLLLFETTYRRKEIGVRRVHGAEISEILQMFNKRFVYILLVSFVIAVPISYFIMDYYYSTFAYRATMHPWIFMLALFLVLFITTVVVTLSTYRAAAENPSESLKSE